MMHRLTRIGSHVRHEPPALVEPFALRDARRETEHLAEQRGMRASQIGGRRRIVGVGPSFQLLSYVCGGEPVSCQCFRLSLPNQVPTRGKSAEYLERSISRREVLTCTCHNCRTNK